MINEIEIVEYKGFKNLKLDNLNQINIISGKNNIGKTALLEALFIYKGVLTSPFGLMFRKETFLFIAKNRNIDEEKLKKYLQKINYKTEDLAIQSKNFYQLNNREKEEILFL